MYTQNVSIPPDYFTWRSTVPSQPDSELSRREENATSDQQKEGKLIIIRKFLNISNNLASKNRQQMKIKKNRENGNTFMNT